MTDQLGQSPEPEQPPLPLRSSPVAQPVLLVETSEQLEAAVAELAKGSGPFAVDAERASGFRYLQRAYLIQVHRRGTSIFLIDVAAIAPVLDAAPFADLARVLQTAEWILHAATQDLGCLAELGLKPTAIFDTELGSRILGLPRVGLGAVVEELLEFRLAKEHSAVDWSQRPMHLDWLNYAALDVDVLPDLRDAIAARLEVAGKLDWAIQEFKHLVGFKPKPPKVDRWRGITGLHEIKDAKKLALARELWTTRENLASKLDVSPGRLIPDSSILAAVKQTPRTKSELASMKTFAGRASRTYLDTWWKAIEVGVSTLDLPTLKITSVGIPNHRSWPNRFPEADARLKALRPAVQSLAEQHTMPVENLLTPDYLRELCWQPPQPISVETVAARLRELGVREWQIEIVAGPLAAALKGLEADDPAV